MRYPRARINNSAREQTRLALCGRDLRTDQPAPLTDSGGEHGNVTIDRRRAAPEPRLIKVLVVDDEAEIVFGAVRRLQAAGFSTLTANEGLAGVKCAHEQHPDLILLDMRMPTWDGLQVLSELRASEDTRNIPVVMLSASLGDRQRSLQAGARLFLSKPYDGTMLIDAVQRVIQEAVLENAG